MAPRADARDPLLVLVQAYFNDYLRRARGASPQTVRAYGHALRLFLIFVAERRGRSLSKLGLEDINADAVLAFLHYLEAVRGNSASTRNSRLAAIRSFTEHLLRHDIARSSEYQRIIAIPTKRSRMRQVMYLEPEQVRAILAAPDRRTELGVRDHALLLFLYNTGARVSEALALRAGDLHLIRPRVVRLHGKGNKERVCPLWSDTAVMLKRLLPQDAEPKTIVFRNARGGPLSRDGVAYVLNKHVATAARKLPTLRRRRITPHVLRHSCAVALLQAGVDVSVIRDYLGHASIATTSRYISSNLEMKREVLDAFWKKAGLSPSRSVGTSLPPNILTFLASL